MQTTGTTTTTLTTFAIETVKVFLFMAISQPDASGMVAAVLDVRNALITLS